MAESRDERDFECIFSVQKVNQRKPVLLFRDTKELCYLSASWEVIPGADKTSTFNFLMLKAKMRSFRPVSQLHLTTGFRSAKQSENSGFTVYKWKLPLQQQQKKLKILSHYYFEHRIQIAK